MNTVKTYNPSDNSFIKEYLCHTPDEVHLIIDQCECAQKRWKQLKVEERLQPLEYLSSLLLSSRDRLASLITAEMGKPIREAKAEIEKCATLCRTYLENGEAIFREEKIQTEFSESFVCFEPLGIVFGIMPWNFPFWQVFRFAVPALIAGNGALLKHASNTIGSGEAIAALFAEAGFPLHLFASLILPGSEAESVIDHPSISAITLTGSERAGSAVAARSGKFLKKSVLELGGSDPFVLLEDADLEAAAEVAARARLLNNGQSCIAAKRFIIAERLYDAFIQKIVSEISHYTIGDPSLPTTDLGPMAKEEIRRDLHAQLQRSLREGARLCAGGALPDGAGFFYPPTVLSDILPSMTVAQEETFGPLFAVMCARDDAHALELANSTPFGLGGAVWTRDRDRGVAFARQIEAGTVAINGMTVSHPALPFGGIKQSGYGRELSHYGPKEFTNIKTIYCTS